MGESQGKKGVLRAGKVGFVFLRGCHGNENYVAMEIIEFFGCHGFFEIKKYHHDDLKMGVVYKFKKKSHLPPTPASPKTNFLSHFPARERKSTDEFVFTK